VDITSPLDQQRNYSRFCNTWLNKSTTLIISKTQTEVSFHVWTLIETALQGTRRSQTTISFHAAALWFHRRTQRCRLHRKQSVWSLPVWVASASGDHRRLTRRGISARPIQSARQVRKEHFFSDFTCCRHRFLSFLYGFCAERSPRRKQRSEWTATIKQHLLFERCTAEVNDADH